jgi:histidyl-tRNA synthetase
MAKGRFREFYQCDFDIAGTYPAMIPDAEVLKVLSDILIDLKVGGFKIKLSHRELLDALMDVSGVPEENFRPICSAVDKLDKLSWAEVKREMVVDKGLSEEAADTLGSYVTGDFSGLGPRQLLEQLSQDERLSAHAKAQSGLSDLRILFDYLESMGCLQYISFDLSLARGLNYYTGLIYEAVLTETDRVGSIAAGGRYDGLVGMFSTQQVLFLSSAQCTVLV